MTIESYEEAIGKLKEGGIEIDFLFPASKSTIDELSEKLRVALPKSYRRMLLDFGILGFEGQTFYGIGRAGLYTKGGSGVLFQTEIARERGQISQRMVRILSSGYGPEFVIDCSQVDSESESPIYEVSELGFRSGMTRVSDSFGNFLLAEVNLLLKNR